MRLQIFLVVADPTRRAVIATAIRANGHSVILFETAEDARVALDTVVPHAVAVDLGASRMSGLVLAEQLKRDPQTRHVRFVAMSRFANEDVRRLARQAGSDDCIELSASADVLASRIADIFQGASS